MTEPTPSPWPEGIARGVHFITQYIQPHVGTEPAKLVFCRNRSKQALFSSWQASSPAAIERTAVETSLTRAKNRQQNDPNPALLVPPGILVVDVDPRNGGDETLGQHPPLPQTVSVATPSGGRHYYYRVPPDRRWPKNALGPGIDLLISYRQEGSGLVGRYVLVPGAKIGGRAGQRHYSLAWGGDIADCPEWIMEASQAASKSPKRKGLLLSSIPDQETREVSVDDCGYIAGCIAPHREAGTGHQLALALAGACAGALWTEESTKRLIRILCATVGDSEEGDRLRVVEDAYKRLRDNKSLASPAVLDSLLGGDVAETIVELLNDLGDFPGYDTHGPVEPLFKARSLHYYGMDDIANEDPPAVAYLVDAMIPRGQLLLLCGPPKGGKTTILTDLVGKMIADEDFLGRSTRLGEDELILWASEEPRDLFCERIIRERRIPTNHLKRLLVTFRREAGPGYRWGEWIREITKHVLEDESPRGKIAMLIVDTFQDWSDIVEEGENSTGSIKKEMQPLQDLAARTGIAIIVLHHTRKGSQGTLVEQVRGATAMTGMVDGIIALLHARGNKRHFKSIGRLSPTCWELEVVFDPESGYSLVESATKKKSAKGTKKRSSPLERVLTALNKAFAENTITVEKHGGVSRVQLRLCMDTDGEPMSDGNLYAVLQKLMAQKRIRVAGRGQGQGREVYYAPSETEAGAEDDEAST